MSVPTFDPFRGLRFSPAAGPIETLVSPPYDVFGEDERRRLGGLSPQNIVHVDYPLESDGPNRYRAAASTLEDWVRRGMISRDREPSFYVYRMEFEDGLGEARRTVGVVGGLGLADADVLPHEQTTPKAKSDRLELLEATFVNLSPIWGLSLSSGLTGLLDPSGRPLCEVRDRAGVIHKLEAVDDPERIELIGRAVAARPVLIADGHHRLAVARSFSTGAGSTLAEADRAMTYVAELTESQMSIEAIHRLVGGVDPAVLEGALGAFYEPLGPVVLGPGTIVSMRRSGSICLVRPDRSTLLLRPKPGVFRNVRPFDSAQLAFALGSLDLEVGYQHGFEETLAGLTAPGVVAAILINPVPLAQIRAVAENGELMPPKSTFFTPKLLTGLVLRDLRVR